MPLLRSLKIIYDGMHDYMNIFFTKTYNLSGSNAQKQQITEIIARKLGYQEISFFKFNDLSDTDLELHTRMDAIMSPLQSGSIILFQYPSMVSLRYDQFAMEHIRHFNNTKVILYVQDLGHLVCPNDYPSLDAEISFLNQADLLILPSPDIKNDLLSHGLSDIPFLYQEIWEYPYNLVRSSVKIEPRESKIRNISHELFYEIKTSGIASITELTNSYDIKNNPLAAGFCLSAGIPIFAPIGSRLHNFISKYHLGFTLEKGVVPADILPSLSAEEIITVTQHIHKIQPLISSGLFTENLLENAVFQVAINNTL